MEYQEFIQEVKNLDFIDTQDTADAAIKAVLGVLASRMEEPHAKKLTEKLPDPLSVERLRGQQVNINEISVNEYIEVIATQFRLNHDQALILVKTILHFTKGSVGNETIKELEKNLPPDWTDIM